MNKLQREKGASKVVNMYMDCHVVLIHIFSME